MFRCLAALVAAVLLASVASAQHCGGYRSNVSYGHNYSHGYQSTYVAPYVAPVVTPYVAPISLLYVLPGTPTAAFYAPSTYASPIVAAPLAVPAAYTAPAPAADPEYQKYLEWKAKKAAVKEDAKVEPEKLDKQYISVLFR